MEGVRKDKELDRKVSADENKVAYQQGMLDTKIKQLELTGQIAEARALAAAAKATANGGPLAREERIRYTSLFSDAGRRMGEGQKALTALQKNAMYSTAKPGSPQAQELEDLRASIKSYKEERDLYGSLLANSQGKQPSLADAEPKPGAKPAAGPAKITTTAERDKLPKGARYVAPDGSVRIKQ